MSKPKKCYFCGKMLREENMQKHHLNEKVWVWVCEKCHNREHRKRHVFSTKNARKSFKKMAETLNLEELRRELSVYQP